MQTIMGFVNFVFAVCLSLIVLMHLTAYPIVLCIFAGLNLLAGFWNVATDDE